MKKKHERSILAMGVMLTALAMTGVQFSQEGRLLPAAKIKVTGRVSIIRGVDKGGWAISPWFQVRRGDDPVRGLDVRVEGIPLRETMPGQYAGVRITTITPVAGNTLRFSISTRSVIHPLPAKKASISGSAVIGSLALITAPASGSSFSLAALGKELAVSWIGGRPPFGLWMGKVSGGAAPEVFSRTGLLGSSFSLPTTLFMAGNSYRISISYDMKPFLINKKGSDPTLTLDSSSVVELSCAVFTSISII